MGENKIKPAQWDDDHLETFAPKPTDIQVAGFLLQAIRLSTDPIDDARQKEDLERTREGVAEDQKKKRTT